MATMCSPVQCETTTKLLDEFYQFWETGEVGLLEKSTSKNLKDHDRNPLAKGTDYEAILQLGKSLGGLTEMNHNLVQVHFLENGKIMVRWEATAKHTAEVFGHPATQKTVYFNGHDILKVEHGKITELWHIEQLLQLNSQLQ